MQTLGPQAGTEAYPRGQLPARQFPHGVPQASGCHTWALQLPLQTCSVPHAHCSGNSTMSHTVAGVRDLAITQTPPLVTLPSMSSRTVPPPALLLVSPS